MKVLAIESSAVTASVAIMTEDTLIAEYTINYKKTHSQTLLPMIDEICRMTENNAADCDIVAVSDGPGSFTGLRIGAATGKGLALALDKPMVAVPTLEAMAYNFYGDDRIICPVMDARRAHLYSGGRIRKILTGMESAFRYLMKTEYRKSGQETENNGNGF